MAATRPLMAAEPMFRAPRPEMVSESNLASCAREAVSRISKAATNIVTAAKQRIDVCMAAVVLGDHVTQWHFAIYQIKVILGPANYFPAEGFFASVFVAGMAKRVSSRSTF